MIKAIETEYNGYKFRSRLEARWAVFFDALGVKYEYEPDGFELPNGERYLPDFRVKCHGTRGACCIPKKKDASDLCGSCKYGDGDSYAYQSGCRHCNWTMETAMGDPESNGCCCKCELYELDTSIPFDLFIEVKGKMTEFDARRIQAFAGSPFDESGSYREDLEKQMNPVLIVGDIPREGCSHDNYALGAYDSMNGTGVYPFNYETIDGDCFAAYPAAHNGRFYLWGDDSNYINPIDIEDVENAYRTARKARFEHGETPVIRHG